MAGLPGKTVALGNPQSSIHQISQVELADWMTEIEGLTGLSGFAFVRGSAAALSELGADGNYALVVTTAAERGIYQRASGSWSKVAELPLIMTESLAADQAAASALAAATSETNAGISATESDNSADASAASALAAANSQSLADVARTQAQLAAVAAGATIYASVAAGEAGTVNGDVFLVATDPGVQVYENAAGTGSFLGWLGEVLLDDVAAVLAWNPPAYPQTGLVLRTRRERFAYSVLASGVTDEDLTTAGGVKLRALPDKEGNLSVSAFDVVGVPTGTAAVDERVKIRAALAAAGEIAGASGGICILHFEPNRVYGITNIARLDCPIPPGVGIDLHGSTLTRVGGLINVPMLESNNGRDHYIRNGVLKGTGAAGNISDQGAALLLLNTGGTSIIENIRTETTNGDGLQFRNATVVMRNITIGDYGRNGISPTSGDFVYDNVRITGDPITGANPGIDLDAENNSSGEFGKHVFQYIEAKDMTFIDFFAISGTEFRHDVRLLGGKVGGKFAGLRFLAATNVVAKNIYIGPEVELIATGTNGSAVRIKDVGGVHFAGTTIRLGAATGSPNAIKLEGTVAGLKVHGARFDGAFASTLNTVGATAVTDIDWADCGSHDRLYLDNVTASRFSGSMADNVTLANATTGNIFDPSFRVPVDQWALIGGATKEAQRIGYILSEAEIDGQATNAGPVLRMRGRNSFVQHTLGEVAFIPNEVGSEDKGASIKATGAGVTEGQLEFLTAQTGTRATRMIIRTNGHVILTTVPIASDEAEAVADGLLTGTLYRTSTGELRIKL